MLVLAIKLGAWWRTGSAVLLADAAESAIDVVTATVLVVALRWARRPADPGHPWGHGKGEYFSALVQGTMIFAAGVALIVESSLHLSEPRPLQGLEAGALLSAGATVINLALGLSLVRAGRRHRSPALTADGRHNLTDVWTTVGGWAGLGLAWVTGWWVLDPLVALVVSLNILATGIGVFRGATRGLLDAALPDTELESLRAAISEFVRAHDEVHEFHALKTRRSSERAFVDFHLIVEGGTTVARSHGICDQIEAAIEATIPGAQVTIHVEPESEREDVARPSQG
jgi:cation diffusion facilitator family transporter